MHRHADGKYLYLTENLHNDSRRLLHRFKMHHSILKIIYRTLKVLKCNLHVLMISNLLFK